MREKLGNLTKIKTGKLDANAASDDGDYPFFTCSKEPLKISTYSYDCECVLVAGNGDLNVKYYNGKFDAYQRTYIIEDGSRGRLYMPYLYLFLTEYVKELRRQSIGGVIKYIKLANLTEAKLNLPEKEVQKQIVYNMGRVQKIIDLRERQLRNLDTLIKARFVEMFGDPVLNPKGWKSDEIENVCDDIFGGGTPSKMHPEYYEFGNIPWVSSKDMKTDVIYDSQIHINQLGIDNSTTKMVPVNSVIMVIRSGILKHTLPIAVNSVPITVNQDLKAFVPGVTIHYRYLAVQLKLLEKDILSGVRAVTADNIEFNSLKKRKILIPPMKLQESFAAFVSEVDKSKAVVQKALDEAQLLFDSLMQQYFG